jgi:hypothetical protein
MLSTHALPNIFFKQYRYFSKFKLFQTNLFYFPLPRELIFLLTQSRKFLSAVDYDLDKVMKATCRHHDINLFITLYVCVYLIINNVDLSPKIIILHAHLQ